MQLQQLVDEYRKKTDEELLLLASERESMVPEAVTVLTDELARRKLTEERLKAFGKEQERTRRKERFRSKRHHTRTANRWWDNVQLIAVYAIGFLLYHFLPFKVPSGWEDAALVTFISTVAIGFTFQELRRQLIFWISLATSSVAQLWVTKSLTEDHWHSKNELLIGFALGFLAWGAMYLLLRRISRQPDSRSNCQQQ